VATISDTDGRILDEVRRALAALDGDIAMVEFDANDPASVQTAIREMELAIDGKIEAFSGNETVLEIAAVLKEKYREELIERAAAARSG